MQCAADSAKLKVLLCCLQILSSAYGAHSGTRKETPSCCAMPTSSQLARQSWVQMILEVWLENLDRVSPRCLDCMNANLALKSMVTRFEWHEIECVSPCTRTSSHIYRMYVPSRVRQRKVGENCQEVRDGKVPILVPDPRLLS